MDHRRFLDNTIHGTGNRHRLLGWELASDDKRPRQTHFLCCFNLMREYESKVFSQAGQDGVIEHIFQVIGTTNKYFVEFGAGDGVDISNTANLRLNKGWTGLLMDSNTSAECVQKEFITAENIQNLFKRYKVPVSFDYLSIDVDGNDFWIWKAITMYWPRLVSVEFNSNFSWEQSLTMPYDPNFKWDGTKYFGASLAALTKESIRKGYYLVHIVGNLDAFFVRRDCVFGLKVSRPQTLLPEPIPCFGGLDNRPWIRI